jgi:TetR/AcrR family transcriptional repressor of nem operon
MPTSPRRCTSASPASTTISPARRTWCARSSSATALAQQIADPLAQLHAYVGYWTACIRDGSAPFCICAMLAAEMPAIPAEVAAQVRGHFDDLAGWLEAVLERGVAEGVFHLRGPAPAEAMAFMACVHGAMLAARAHGDTELFGTIMKPVLHRLTHR